MRRRLWAVLTASLLLALTSLAGVMAANEPSSFKYDRSSSSTYFHCYEINPSADNNVLYELSYSATASSNYIAPTLDPSDNVTACSYSSISTTVRAVDPPDITTGSNSVTQTYDSSLFTTSAYATGSTTAPGRPTVQRDSLNGTITLTFGDLPPGESASNVHGYVWKLQKSSSSSSGVVYIHSSQSTVTIPDFTFLDVGEASWPYFPTGQYIHIPSSSWRQSSFSAQVTGTLPDPDSHDLYVQDGDLYTSASPTIKTPITVQNDPDSSTKVLASISWDEVEGADGYQVEGLPSGSQIANNCHMQDSLAVCAGTRLPFTIEGAGNGNIRVRSYIENTSVDAGTTPTVGGESLYIMPSVRAYSEWSPYATLLYERQISGSFDGTASEIENWGPDVLGGREATKAVVSIFGMQATEMLMLVLWIALALAAGLVAGMSTPGVGAAPVIMGGLVGTVAWMCGPLWMGIPWTYTLFPMAILLVAALMVAKARFS